MSPAIEYLPIPKQGKLADQCREMGLAVGDVIVGFEQHFLGGWHEARLELLWLGQEAAVFREQTRSESTGGLLTEPREESMWALEYRRWQKITPTTPSRPEPTVMSTEQVIWHATADELPDVTHWAELPEGPAAAAPKPPEWTQRMGDAYEQVESQAWLGEPGRFKE